MSIIGSRKSGNQVSLQRAPLMVDLMVLGSDPQWYWYSHDACSEIFLMPILYVLNCV